MEYLLDMDLVSFDELTETVISNIYSEKIDHAWMMFAASQCAKQKDFEKAIIAPYQKLLDPRDTVDDQPAFLDRFKQGI